jgi:hypothetical protein
MEKRPAIVFICRQQLIIFSILGLLLYKLSMKSGKLTGSNVCLCRLITCTRHFNVSKILDIKMLLVRMFNQTCIVYY